MARQISSSALGLLLLLLLAVSSNAFVVRQSKRETGAAPTYASAVAPHPRLPNPTRLSMASTALQEVESMRIGELKKELESYGISTKTFLEKSELVDAVKKARADGLEPKQTATAEPTTTTSTASSTSSSTSTSSSSTSSSSDTDKRPREERLKEEMANCQKNEKCRIEKGIDRTRDFHVVLF